MPENPILTNYEYAMLKVMEQFHKQELSTNDALNNFNIEDLNLFKQYLNECSVNECSVRDFIGRLIENGYITENCKVLLSLSEKGVSQYEELKDKALRSEIAANNDLTPPCGM